MPTVVLSLNVKESKQGLKKRHKGDRNMKLREGKKMISEFRRSLGVGCLRRRLQRPVSGKEKALH